MHLNEDEPKSALRWSETDTPNRLDSLKEAPDFPCPQKKIIVKDYAILKCTLNSILQSERAKTKTSLGIEKAEGSNAAAWRAIVTSLLRAIKNTVDQSEWKWSTVLECSNQ